MRCLPDCRSTTSPASFSTLRCCDTAGRLTGSVAASSPTASGPSTRRSKIARLVGSPSAVHPVIDLCNAVPMAYAVPVAVFDVAKIAEGLEVRYADGSEVYESFSGAVEQPEPREVVFADSAGRAHARRWTNRQSARSAVRAETTRVLIVAEALHDSARADIERLGAALPHELTAVWSVTPRTGVLTSSSPRVELAGISQSGGSSR